MYRPVEASISGPLRGLPKDAVSPGVEGGSPLLVIIPFDPSGSSLKLNQKDLPPQSAEGRYHGAEEKKKKGGGRGGGGWTKAPPGGWSRRRNGTAVRIRARNMRLRSQVASRVLVARSARKK